MIIEEIKKLIKLQKLDTEAQALRREADEGPRRIEELESGLSDLEQELAAGQAELDELNANRKEIENSVEDNKYKMKRSQSRLPMIKNNREYKAMLKEIDDLKRAKFDLEEDILALMERSETLEAEHKDRLQRADEIRAELEQNRQSIMDRVAECEARLVGLDAEREELREEIDEGLISRYDHVSYNRGGVGVVAVVGGACQMCYMNLTAQEFVDLQHMNRLMTCPSCNRLMYWADHELLSDKSEDEAVEQTA